MIPFRAQSGFSLVETLVAITILLIVIVGPMTIISSASNSTSFASEQVIAFFLAQEGAELAQKARDDMVLKGFLPVGHADYEATPWADFSSNTGVFASCFTADGCGLEITADTTGSIASPITCLGTACRLYYNSAGTRSRYTHVSTGNQQTAFTRKVNFEYPTDPTNDWEIKVTSQVEWLSGSSRRTQSVEVETFLFNVYGN